MSNISSASVASGQVANASDYNDLRTDVLENAGDYAVATGSSNNFAVTIDSDISSLSAGLVVKFKANFAITGAATLNVNSIGATAIKKNGSDALITDDIKNGQICIVMYDGTFFQILGGVETSFDAITPQTTKGDLISRTSSAAARLAVGSDGQRLEADSAESVGVKWATPPDELRKTAGQAFSAGDPVFVEDSTTFDFTVLEIANTHAPDQSCYFGLSTTNSQNKYKLAQSFNESTGFDLDSVQIEILKGGSPADNVVLAIQGDNSGEPDGSDLATATVAGSGLPTSVGTLTTFTLSSTVTISASTTYWIVLRRSGALDNSNNYYVRGRYNSNGYANGELAGEDAGGWDTNPPTDPFMLDMRAILGSSSAEGNLYLTKADVAGRYEAFAGFIIEDVAQGATARVRAAGVAGGFTSLTIGDQYYLSDTEGGISTSAGSNTRKVGIAISATEMLVTNIW